MNTMIYNPSIKIGNILMALEVFKDLKHQLKYHENKLKEKVAQAKKDSSAFGMFEDCGSYYEQSLYGAEAVYSHMTLHIRNQKVRKEKYFRKLRQNFLAEHPEYQEILAQLIEEKNKEIAEYHSKKSVYF